MFNNRPHSFSLQFMQIMEWKQRIRPSSKEIINSTIITIPLIIIIIIVCINHLSNQVAYPLSIIAIWEKASLKASIQFPIQTPMQTATSYTINNRMLDHPLSRPLQTFTRSSIAMSIITLIFSRVLVSSSSSNPRIGNSCIRIIMERNSRMVRFSRNRDRPIRCSLWGRLSLCGITPERDKSKLLSNRVINIRLCLNLR